MAVPVSVLRLPRGPEGSGRGFSSTTLNRRRGEAPEVAEVTKATQATRAALRRRFLLSLAAAREQTVTFVLCQHGRVSAVLGAVWVPDGTEVCRDDGSAAVAFQVDALQTPLGVQRAALLRGRDVVAFGFQVAEK
ncbi:gem-associated protein 7 [Lagopus leucura]|uniref:gem-associated protein 7 n=1 Tax=Lagopus leucura TaxID=30410 RepID=UPI001C66947A|nr:gem-associated protein 7 [Lagopus leucura]